MPASPVPPVVDSTPETRPHPGHSSPSSAGRFRLQPVVVLALGFILGTWPHSPATAAPPDSPAEGASIPGGRSDRLGRQLLDEDRRLDRAPSSSCSAPAIPATSSEFDRFTTGGGTFATGLEHLEAWLDDFRPTVVVFNYGGNDAGGGREGLARFKDNMERSVARSGPMAPG